MPAAFEKCRKNGGKIRTIVINKKKGTYMHVCYLNDKAYPGEVRTKKKSTASLAKELVRKLLDLKGYWNDRRNKKQN